MTINYYPDTDSLYIELSSEASYETIEISEGVALDYNEHGVVVGIDIDNATTKVNLQELVLNKLPLAAQRLSA